MACLLLLWNDPARAEDRNLRPDFLAPADNEAFPWSTASVHLAWKRVGDASRYGVRVDDWTNPGLRDPRNNCPQGPHYVCREDLERPEADVPVRPGHVYRAWVRAIYPDGYTSQETHRFFSVGRIEPGNTPGAFLWRGLIEAAEQARTFIGRLWPGASPQLAPYGPIILFPAHGTHFPSTTTAVAFSWEPFQGALVYNLGMKDGADPGLRSPRSNCPQDYLCLGYWDSTGIEQPVREGHIYEFCVAAVFAGGRQSKPSCVGFHVDGAPSPGLKEDKAAFARERARWHLDRMRALAKRLKEVAIAARSVPSERTKNLHNYLIAGFLASQDIFSKAVEDEAALESAGRDPLAATLARQNFIARADLVRAELNREVNDAQSEWERLPKARSPWRRVLPGAAGAGLSGLVLWARRRRKPALAIPAPEPAPSGADTRGRLLNGNYRVDGELGRGGMGVVYEATDLNLKRKVAIKRMNLEAEQEGLGHELFLKEAQLVASLKHPNIVQVFDMFEEGGRVYLVFEHVAGRTLQGEGKVPLERANKILTHVCAALDYAHARKVIHRDLKPSNIMVGGDGIVKVMDFGIARQIKNTMTQTRGWGTPAYMAPEQELGTVSKETDLYALGVCLYELVTGRLPFTGPDFLAQKQRMEYSVEGVLETLKPMLAKALQADPARRYRSAAELARALQELQ